MLIRALFLPVAAFLFFAAAQGADVDEVKEKLFQAKKEYDGEVQKFRKAVGEVLDKREEAARSSGNKKLLDQVKADRDRFDKTGEPPTNCPKGLLAQVGAARTKLDRAYSAAVKDLVKLREDAAAEVIEKEQQKLFIDSVLLYGKKQYLVTLKHYDVKVLNGWFANDGTIIGYKVKRNGVHASHSIFLHPPDKGTAQVKYSLGGKWLVLRTSVGVPTVDDTRKGPASALTFEVLGDGKSLWKSEPVTKLDDFQTCNVRVEKVKVLTLLVHAEAGAGRAVWLEPILVE